MVKILRSVSKSPYVSQAHYLAASFNCGSSAIKGAQFSFLADQNEPSRCIRGLISVLAARSCNGDVALYPPGENQHRDGILLTSIVPAINLPEDMLSDG